MNESPRVFESGLEVDRKSSGPKERTFKDTFLISAWVAAYVGVLIIFRVANALGRLLPSKRKSLPRS